MPNKKFGAFDILLTIFLIWLVIVLLALSSGAQDPPLPPSPTVSLKVSWNIPPAADVFSAIDDEGNLIPLVYRVYHTSVLANTNSWTNFNVILTTNWLFTSNLTATNIQATITNLDASKPHFFMISVSNRFLASKPSRLVGLPAPHGRPEGFYLLAD